MRFTLRCTELKTATSFKNKYNFATLLIILATDVAGSSAANDTILGHSILSPSLLPLLRVSFSCRENGVYGNTVNGFLLTWLTSLVSVSNPCLAKLTNSFSSPNHQLCNITNLFLCMCGQTFFGWFFCSIFIILKRPSHFTFAKLYFHFSCVFVWGGHMKPFCSLMVLCILSDE